VADPFAGGGSIPFESLRYGFRTTANELNPVASVILRGTLDYPARFGITLGADIARYGGRLAERVRSRLEPFFPIQEGDAVHAHLWVRTAKCPYTGRWIPFSPNWWLSKPKGKPEHTWVSARPTFDAKSGKVRFQIHQGGSSASGFDPARGTIKGGEGVSPWADGQSVDGDYLKREAREGGLSQQLYARVVKRGGKTVFEPPTQADQDAADAARLELERLLPMWESSGIVPNEEITAVSNYDRGHRLYGVRQWKQAFLPRQLLTLGTAVEELRLLERELRVELPNDRAEAVLTYLALAVDKACDYNSRYTRWNPTRHKIINTFDKHGFGFLWSHSEFDGARSLIQWGVEQVVDAYTGIATLARGDTTSFGPSTSPVPIDLFRGSALSLHSVQTGSVGLVCVDPPYYENVMYAECSDFFYVWMKRTLASAHPALFTDELTNKDDEAVANAARFASLGVKKKKDLAREDYERKMAGAFREMHRVLAEDGVLTVMFTHKKVEAWDTLATSLIGAGFAIHSSWPVHTESDRSLHQAKKNSAQSTILLTCRKREPRTEPVWWDDIKGNVRRAAREKAEEFERQGIRGVDLYIATFGPTLAILSENWPVLTSEVDERTGEPKPLRPEIALDLAREEVVALRKQGLLLGRSVTFDPFTDWYLMAWDAFMAQEFPGDEALKLALALGLDLEKQVIAEKKLVSKKGKTVTLQQPSARRKRGMVDPDQRTFTHWIDAAHTAMLLYKEDGSQACQHFLRETGLQNDSTFKALIQALLQAIPRTKQKGKFARPEAEVLDAMRLAFFDELPVPPDEEVEIKTLQGDLFDGASVAAEKPDDEDIADEDEPDEDEEDDE